MKIKVEHLNFWKSFYVALSPQIFWITLFILTIKLNLPSETIMQYLSRPTPLYIFDLTIKIFTYLYFGTISLLLAYTLYRKLYKPSAGLILGTIVGYLIYSISPIIILGFTLGVGTD